MGTVPPAWSTWNTIYNTNMKFLVLACLAVACSGRPQFLFLVPGSGGTQTAEPTLTQEQISTLQRNLQALLPQLLATTAATDATAAAAAGAAPGVATAPQVTAVAAGAPVAE